MMSDGGRTRIRRGDLVPTLVGLFGLVGAACLFLAAVGTAVSAPGRVAIAAVSIPFFILVVRLLPTGVYVDGDGVLIRNVTSSRRLGWGEIDQFALRTAHGFPAGVVLLADGSQLTISSLNPSVDGPGEILPLIDQLNARLSSATGRSLATAAEDLTRAGSSRAGR